MREWYRIDTYSASGILPALQCTAYLAGWRWAPHVLERVEVLGHAMRNRTIRVGVHRGHLAGVGSFAARVALWDRQLAALLGDRLSAMGAPLTFEPGPNLHALDLGPELAAKDDDLVIAEVPDWRVGPFVRAGYHLIPKRIGHVESTKADAVETSLARRIRKQAKARGLRFEVSRRRGDLVRFERDYHRPSMIGRHGDMAAPTPLAVLQVVHSYGWLLRVFEGNEWISGALVAPSCVRPRRLEISVLGIDPRRLDDELARSAPVLFARDFAKAKGYDECDHLGSAPFLDDGIHRRKLRWGSRVEDMSWRRDRVVLLARTEAGRAFIAQNPFYALRNGALEEVHR